MQRWLSYLVNTIANSLAMSAFKGRIIWTWKRRYILKSSAMYRILIRYLLDNPVFSRLRLTDTGLMFCKFMARGYKMDQSSSYRRWSLLFNSMKEYSALCAVFPTNVKGLYSWKRLTSLKMCSTLSAEYYTHYFWYEIPATIFGNE